MISKLHLRLLQLVQLPLSYRLIYAQHLRSDLVPLEGYFVTLFLRGPEIWDGEPVLQVRAEVVHPADREGEVHAELGGRVSCGCGLSAGVWRVEYLENFEVGAAEGAED